MKTVPICLATVAGLALPAGPVLAAAGGGAPEHIIREAQTWQQPAMVFGVAMPESSAAPAANFSGHRSYVMLNEKNG